VRRAGASAYPMRRRVQLSRFTVLVVDDEAPNRANITAILSPVGRRVLLAEDGFKALGLLGEAVDLAIVDTQMPGMHGFDLIRALRIRQPQMRVLLLAQVRQALPGTVNGTPQWVAKGHRRRGRA